MTRVLNTRTDFRRAAEAHFLGLQTRRERMDLNSYMRPRLEHPTDIDPLPRVTGNAKHQPRFNDVIDVYVEPPKRVPRPASPPPPAFIPSHMEEGDWWEVRCAQTRYPLFKVRGTALHANREALRYCEQYDIEVAPPPYRLQRLPSA